MKRAAEDSGAPSEKRRVVDLCASDDSDVEFLGSSGGAAASDRALAERLQAEEDAKERLGSSDGGAAAALSIKEMRALIKSAGMSSADCVEKSDIQRRCSEARARLAEAEALRSRSDRPAAAAAAAGARYAWRPLHSRALGRDSPGNAGAVRIADIATGPGQPKWVVVSNYMIDGETLARAWPGLADVARVIVFHGEAGTARGLPARLPLAEVHDLTPKKLTFTHPGTGRPFKNDWGCHHSKFFLVGFEDAVRVAIMTANLIPSDLDCKAQGVWLQDFPAKEASSASCDFEDSLVGYVETLEAHAGGGARDWSGLGKAFEGAPRLRLSEALRRFDFKAATARLVPSAPGYHIRDLDAFGLRRVAKVLAAEGPAAGAAADDDVVCQFSSFSNPAPKLLAQLGDAFHADGAPRAPLRLLWPTTAEVRASVEGYAAGGCMPSYSKNVDKADRAVLRRWTSGDRGAPADYVTARQVTMPHIKTWTRVSSDGRDVRWSLLTSANLSGGAWGQRQKNDTQLFVMHWELGVLVTPSTAGGALETTQAPNGGVAVPLPFRLPAEPYRAGDRPFKWDELFTDEPPDRFGRFGTGA